VCIEFCPVDCLYKVPGPENPEEHGYVSVNGIVVVDEEICIGCKLCAKYCPWETIDMVKREDRNVRIVVHAVHIPKYSFVATVAPLRDSII